MLSEHNMAKKKPALATDFIKQMLSKNRSPKSDALEFLQKSKKEAAKPSAQETS